MGRESSTTHSIVFVLPLRLQQHRRLQLDVHCLLTEASMMRNSRGRLHLEASSVLVTRKETDTASLPPHKSLLLAHYIELPLRPQILGLEFLCMIQRRSYTLRIMLARSAHIHHLVSAARRLLPPKFDWRVGSLREGLQTAVGVS